MEFENWSASSRFFWVVEINLINVTHNPRADPCPLDARAQNVPKERSGFCRP
jgi:hypothetical protein